MPGYEKKAVKHIHEGRYVAEVSVTLHYDDDIPWSPTIAPIDIEKIDRVARALKRGDIAEAAKDAKVFEMLPLAGE